MKNQINLKKGKINSWTKIEIICIMLLSFCTIQAQTFLKSVTTQENNITVQGSVSDNSGTLKGVNVALEGTKFGTTTDSKGNFKFPKQLKQGDVLVFSFLGLKTQKVVINNTNSSSTIKLNVYMELLEISLLSKGASKKVYKSKR